MLKSSGTEVGGPNDGAACLVTEEHFVRIPNSIVLSTTLSARDVRVYAVLASHCWYGPDCKLLRETIAAEANISVSSVNVALRQLADEGLIEVTRTRGASVYHLPRRVKSNPQKVEKQPSRKLESTHRKRSSSKKTSLKGEDQPKKLSLAEMQVHRPDSYYDAPPIFGGDLDDS
jgi:predicted transcriptional regulator